MSDNPEIKIDVGDEVRHGPSGEHWIVAAVDGENLFWCGFPFGGSGKVVDCTLIKQATPVEQKKLLADLAAVKGNERPSILARIRIAKESKPALSLEAPIAVDVALEYADGTRGPKYGDGDEREGQEFGEALKTLGAEVKRLRQLTGYRLRFEPALTSNARGLALQIAPLYCYPTDYPGIDEVAALITAHDAALLARMNKETGEGT
jgi:hypothetical protein